MYRLPMTGTSVGIQVQTIYSVIIRDENWAWTMSHRKTTNSFIRDVLGADTDRAEGVVLELRAAASNFRRLAG